MSHANTYLGFIGAELGPEGECERRKCDGCHRVVPLYELLDARPIAEFPGDWACSGCTSRLDREGIVPRSVWAAALGAPLKVINKFKAAEARRRAQ